MQVVSNPPVVLGVDIGGTNIRLALVTATGELRNPMAIKVAELGAAAPLDRLVSIITDYAAEHAVPGELRAIGIGIPGIVNRDGRIISCPNITFLEDSNLKELLSRKLQIPVFLEKDVNFILYGEYRSLQLREFQNLIGFYVGTGFGCSLIINGDIYCGSRGFAGELGHIPLKNHTGTCNCGNEGCLELYGAGRALVDISQRLQIPVGDFFAKAPLEEQRAFLDYLRVGMLSTINVFDPEAIIIGGGVVQMEGFPWDELEKMIREGVRSELIRNELQIVPSQGETFGGCLGAAYYCFDRLQA